MVIKYSAIEVKDPKYNATIEGVILDYINNNNLYDNIWNNRED